MWTHADGLARLGSKPEVKVAHATTLRKLEDGSLAVKYHATDVVTIHPDGTYTLRTGGWYTPTTKKRIREFSPARLYASNGLWYLADGIMFEEGMRVTDNANVFVGSVQSGQEQIATEARKRALDRQVSKYIKGFLADIAANGLADPGTGDCWGCCMHATDGTPDVFGLDHYLQHFEEGYYVPSLLWNAIVEAGYNDPAFIWHLIQRGDNVHFAQSALTRFFRRRKMALLGLAPMPTGSTKGWQG